MSILLTAKPPAAVYDYTWLPPLADGDGIATASITVASGSATIVSYSADGDVFTFRLSGGAVGETAALSATAGTNSGEVLVETLYVPIISKAAQFGSTVREVVEFALRRITGARRTPSDGEADDALERLNDMLALWRIDGLDVGVPLPLELETILVIPDEFLLCLKYNLAVAVHDLYTESPVPPLTYRMAEDSKRLVANKLFVVPQLRFSSTLTTRPETVEDLF